MLRGAAAGLVLLLGCGGDGAGPAPASGATVEYREEAPGEESLLVTVSAGGALTALRERPRGDCPDVHDARCWARERGAGRLDPGEQRALDAGLAALDPAAVAREEAVAPGAARLQLVAARAGGRVEVLASCDSALRDPRVGAIRDLLRAAAARVLPAGPPGDG